MQHFVSSPTKTWTSQRTGYTHQTTVFWIKQTFFCSNVTTLMMPSSGNLPEYGAGSHRGRWGWQAQVPPWPVLWPRGRRAASDEEQQQLPVLLKALSSDILANQPVIGEPSGMSETLVAGAVWRAASCCCPLSYFSPSCPDRRAAAAKACDCADCD